MNTQKDKLYEVNYDDGVTSYVVGHYSTHDIATEKVKKLPEDLRQYAQIVEKDWDD